jgi:hypothetical protein
VSDVREPQNAAEQSEAPTAEEREVATDEAAMPQTAEAEPEKTEYIEFVGQEPYGTEFISEHTVTRRQLRDAWDVAIPKDLKWTKTQGGPNAGRMLVPVSDMTPEAAEGFEKDPMFKRVSL